MDKGKWKGREKVVDEMRVSSGAMAVLCLLWGPCLRFQEGVVLA